MLLSTAREKFVIGKFTEAQVLEVEVDNLNLTLEIEQLLQELSNRTRVLCDYIGWDESASLVLQVPTKPSHHCTLFIVHCQL